MRIWLPCCGVGPRCVSFPGVQCAVVNCWIGREAASFEKCRRVTSVVGRIGGGLRELHNPCTRLHRRASRELPPGQVQRYLLPT